MKAAIPVAAIAGNIEEEPQYAKAKKMPPDLPDAGAYLLWSGKRFRRDGGDVHR